MSPRIFAASFALMLAACPQPPLPPPVPPDASDAAAAPQTPCEAACLALAALACPESLAPNCVTTLAHIEGARFIRVGDGGSFSCTAIAGVTSVAQARAQGVACGQ